MLVPPSLAAEIDRQGLPHEVGDEPSRAVIDEMWERVRLGPPEAVVGLIDRELFADHCTRAMLPAARARCDRVRPHLVVRESCEYGSAVVAAEAAIPLAQVGVSQASIEWGVLEMVSPTIDRFGGGVASAIARGPSRCRRAAGAGPAHHRSRNGRRLSGRDPSHYARRALDRSARRARPHDRGGMPRWLGHHSRGAGRRRAARHLPALRRPSRERPHDRKRARRAGRPRTGARSRQPTRPRTDDVAPLRETIQRVLDDPTYRDAARRVAAELATTPTLDNVVKSLPSRAREH